VGYDTLTCEAFDRVTKRKALNVKTIVFAVVFVLTATLTHAQETPSPGALQPTTPRLDWTPYVVLIAGQTADAVTTARNYGRGFTESNPMFGTAPSLGRVLTIKTAETAGLSLLVWQLQRTGHPKMAKFIGYFGGIGGVVPAVINTAAVKGTR